MDVPVRQMMNDRLLLTPIEEEDVTTGGIIIPDSAKKRPVRGRVLAVGPGRRTESSGRIAVQIPLGAIVLFDRFSGIETEIDGEAYSIMRETEILAVVED